MITTPGLSSTGINSNTLTIVNKSLAYFGYELHALTAKHEVRNPIVENGVSPWVASPTANSHDEWNYHEFPRQGTYKLNGQTHGYFFQEHVLSVHTDDMIWVYGTFSEEEAARLETAVFDDALGMVLAFFRAFEHKPVTLALSSESSGKLYDFKDYLLVASPKSWI